MTSAINGPPESKVIARIGLDESEQTLRGSVVHGKVTNGFRAELGAKAYPALQTILVTAKQKGGQAFQVFVNLMGKPVLPFLVAQAREKLRLNSVAHCK